jgi:hypothetical protein
MQVWDCSGGTNQNWYFKSAENGSVVIQNQYSGKCLDDGGTTSQASSATPIKSWTCASGTTNWHQVWQLVTYNN